MGGPRFRTAGADDVEALVRLVESAYRGEASREGWTTEAHLLEGQRTDADAVREIIGSPEARILVVEVSESAGESGRTATTATTTTALRSWAVASWSHDPTPPPTWACSRWPRPAKVTGWAGPSSPRPSGWPATSWGPKHMVMTVIRQRTDLIRWYERLGYRRTGETQPFPYGDERFGLPTRPDLEFVVLAKPLDSGATSSAAIEKL